MAKRNMVLENVSSDSKNLIKGDWYAAKVDSDGLLRVRDGADRWSKYSINKFKVIADPDNQLSDIKPFGEVKKSKATPCSYATAPCPTVSVAPPTTASTATYKKEVENKGAEVMTSTTTTPVVSTKKTRTLSEVLMEQGVPVELIKDMNEYRKEHTNATMPENIKARIPKPTELYEGGQLWTMCIAAVLSGRHILLSGGKATGKNTLTQSLAFAFQRPLWDISFHSNIGKDELIGSETFKNNEVVFNPGMMYLCAQYGGIGVLDEINMAKDSAISVMNSILDDRRVIDVPGYDRLELNEATTFIGTMNYGYAGTRQLNEALTSRFVIPEVRELDKDAVLKLLVKKFPDASKDTLGFFAGVFDDLRTKALNSEISTASVDLRGIIAAIDMCRYGIRPNAALISNVVNKAFDEFERKIVTDTVGTRIPETWIADVVFPKADDKRILVDFNK